MKTVDLATVINICLNSLVNISCWLHRSGNEFSFICKSLFLFSFSKCYRKFARSFLLRIKLKIQVYSHQKKRVECEFRSFTQSIANDKSIIQNEFSSVRIFDKKRKKRKGINQIYQTVLFSTKKCRIFPHLNMKSE